MTLPRILEPEVMDTAEEAAAYDHMDHAEVNRLLVDRFLELGGGGTVLDVGTGPAHVPIELVRRGAADHVVALDAARHMLRTALAHLDRTGTQDRIRLVLGDAKRLPLPDASVDAVLSNSIVHHLEDPAPFLREIVRVLRPGGALLLRDLLRPEDEDELERLVRTHASDCDDRQRGLFRDSLRAAFTLEEVTEMVKGVVPSVEVTRSSDRHWTAERPRPRDARQNPLSAPRVRR